MRSILGRIAALVIKLLQRRIRGSVTVEGRPYTVTPEVFNPKLYVTTTLLASCLRVSRGDRVLDMGTGSGLLAIEAARCAREVVAIDINPEAVRCAEENARAHGVSDRISVMQGDLFTPLAEDEVFDVILFNPPYLDGSGKSLFDYAIYDPDKRVVGRFLKEAKSHLAPSGYIQMVYSSIADPRRVLTLAQESGFMCVVVMQKRVLFERFFVFELFPRHTEGSQ